MSLTQTPSHQALRIILLILAIILALGGIVAFVASELVASIAPASVHFVAPGLGLILLKVAGVAALTLSYLSFRASQDPVRYVAIVDALAFLLLAGAALDCYGFLTLHAPPFDSPLIVALRVAVRVALALLLIALRPRSAGAI